MRFQTTGLLDGTEYTVHNICKNTIQVTLPGPRKEGIVLLVVEREARGDNFTYNAKAYQYKEVCGQLVPVEVESLPYMLHCMQNALLESLQW